MNKNDQPRADSVSFTVDAGIIDRLGRELVAKAETAVAELIKNAYDADATEVSLWFQNVDDPGGTLTITDNGTGMGRKELIDGFMRLSSNAKVLNPVSPGFKRKRAGRKGIGRFAVQRLGEELLLTTKTKNGTKAIELSIDWRKFTLGKDLTSLGNPVVETDADFEQGTVLQIRNLREAWSEARIKRVYRYVSSLLQPFPLSKSSPKTQMDPGFKVEILKGDGTNLELVADERTRIRELALAHIEGWVDESGTGWWGISSRKTDLEELDSGPHRLEGTHFPDVANVRIVADYFIYNQGLIAGGMETTIRDLAKHQGGIRLYRNGFRVPPYGNTDNDWLSLDQSSRRRAILPPHANFNFFGFIEIDELDDEIFDETASREGLIESEPFEQLTEFAHTVLITAIQRIAATRLRKVRASQKNWKKSPLEGISRETEKLERLAKSGSANEAKILSFASAIRHHAMQQEVEQEKLLQEQSVLRVLAGLGLATAQFAHELKQRLGAARISASQLETELDGTDYSEIVSDLKANIEHFAVYAGYFGAAALDNASRKMTSLELGTEVEKFADSVGENAQQRGIELEVSIPHEDVYTVPMHSAEIASVMFNFYSNAEKALKLTDVDPAKILINVGKSNGFAFIEFCDNGIGIRDDLRESIFEAFFTTTSQSRTLSSSEMLSGAGLGLKIVRDIARSYDGDCYVSAAPDGYKTCVRFEVPKQ